MTDFKIELPTGEIEEAPLFESKVPISLAEGSPELMDMWRTGEAFYNAFTPFLSPKAAGQALTAISTMFGYAAASGIWEPE